ncbi:hypothetical protein BC835DRAFT_907573 [Cytidiella melzeri]|nr:hypothetical protein BC835DRAFT_907573 [Cytidiella melzeri]
MHHGDSSPWDITLLLVSTLVGTSNPTLLPDPYIRSHSAFCSLMTIHHVFARPMMSCCTPMFTPFKMKGSLVILRSFPLAQVSEASFSLATCFRAPTSDEQHRS